MNNLTGLAESFVKNIGVLAKGNDPQYKVTPVGFLKYLLENPLRYEISNLKQIQEGHEHELKIRYMQRGTESEVTDRDDCLTNITPAWKTATIARPYFSKIAISIPDSEIRKWDSAASGKSNAGGVDILNALYMTALVKINGLLQKIDANLLLAQNDKWGVNAVTGSNAVQAVNFTNTPQISDGIVRLLKDYQDNEMAEVPVIVGNGIVSSYNLLQSMKAGIDSGGFGANQTYKLYNDPKSASVWGANHFGVFAPGFTGFVDFNKYVGGFRHNGTSVKFTLPVPFELASGELSALTLDAQLKYQDCNVYDEDNNLITREGWIFLLSKSYGLFNSPADMFKATVPAIPEVSPAIPGDRLQGVNGTFHYVGTSA
ncbi:MAG: hypothetical protein LBL07_00445 [Tannerella sp.]|jgi:hypothetical protein|nr:hypothetical protein [Tannerella sp.]